MEPGAADGDPKPGNRSTHAHRPAKSKHSIPSLRYARRIVHRRWRFQADRSAPNVSLTSVPYGTAGSTPEATLCLLPCLGSFESRVASASRRGSLMKHECTCPSEGNTRAAHGERRVPRAEACLCRLSVPPRPEQLAGPSDCLQSRNLALTTPSADPQHQDRRTQGDSGQAGEDDGETFGLREP